MQYRLPDIPFPKRMKILMDHKYLTSYIYDTFLPQQPPGKKYHDGDKLVQQDGQKDQQPAKSQQTVNQTNDA